MIGKKRGTYIFLLNFFYFENIESQLKKTLYSNMSIMFKYDK